MQFLLSVYHHVYWANNNLMIDKNSCFLFSYRRFTQKTHQHRWCIAFKHLISRIVVLAKTKSGKRNLNVKEKDWGRFSAFLFERIYIWRAYFQKSLHPFFIILRKFPYFFRTTILHFINFVNFVVSERCRCPEPRFTLWILKRFLCIYLFSAICK